MRRTLLLVLVAIVAAACGGSGDAVELDPTGSPGRADDRQAMLELVREDLLISGEDDPNALHLSEDESECVATYMVDEFGVEYLEVLGYDIDTGDVTPAPLFETPLPAEQRPDAIRAVMGCIDFTGHFRRLMQGDTRLSSSQIDCFTSSYMESGYLERTLFSAPDAESQQASLEELADVSKACLPVGV